MLILLSDLHLTDGTAGVHHLSADSFRRVFEGLADRAKDAGAKDIKLVFLGDIYDMIRTEAWFGYAPDDRPWGTHPSEEAAHHVFEALVAKNQELFDLLSGSLVDAFGFPVEPERVFIPGNHDRLTDHYPSLRRRVRETLGQPPTDEPFDHVFIDLDHGVYGRHGQEWDPFNFEGSDAFSETGSIDIPFDDYMLTPIGDLIACEFAAKLPGVVRSSVPGGPDGPDATHLYERFKDLFDVRPLIAMREWITYQAQHQGETLQKYVNDAVQDTIDGFQELPYVEGWVDRHDKRWNPFDRADSLQMLMFILKRVRFTHLEVSLTRADRAEVSHDATYALKAAEEFKRIDADPDLAEGILYVVYGHTHHPDQRAIGVVGDGAKERERMYINTGTWRPVHRQDVNGESFMSWKNITHTVVLRPGERLWGGRASTFPSIETWTGTIKDG